MLEKKLLNEPVELYKREIEKADDEEVFLRGGVFKKLVPKIYSYTCSISGLRVDSTTNIQLIDACHIVPFSESHDDTITNGISLCPNLHRAFDRGLIAIDSNYRVLTKNNFIESTKSAYQIRIFEGKEILLPESQKYFPSLENLASHRKRFDFFS